MEREGIRSLPFVLVHIRTVLSCDADAMYALERIVGAHATSRTQSLCPWSVVVLLCVFDSGLNPTQNTRQRTQPPPPKHLLSSSSSSMPLTSTPRSSPSSHCRQ